MPKSPMDILIDNADLRCTICDAPMGECDCWTKCDCGWSYEKDTQCNNPVHDSTSDGTLKVIAKNY